MGRGRRARAARTSTAGPWTPSRPCVKAGTAPRTSACAFADEIEKKRCRGASRSRRGSQPVIREILSVCKDRRGGLLRRAAPSTKAPTVNPVYIYSNATKHTIARPQVRTISVRSSATIHARRNENAALACEFYERANICVKKSQLPPVRGERRPWCDAHRSDRRSRTCFGSCGAPSALNSALPTRARNSPGSYRK